MRIEHGTDRMIEQLAAGLTPAGRLPAPGLRAGAWLLAVGLAAAALIARFANLGLFAERMATPRIAVECVATALTAVTAIVAAFELSVPDRSARWAWLPVPSLLLWLGASGLGCLRNGLSLHQHGSLIGESGHCFAFICGVSVPLAAALFWMLRRARPLTPLPVTLLGTLGSAAAAAFLLQFFHPFDVTVIDLALHLAGIGVVVVAGVALRRPLLAADY